MTITNLGSRRPAPPCVRLSAWSLIGLAVVSSLLVLACGGSAAAESAYEPPPVAAATDGWEHYVDAPMVDTSTAANLNPRLGSAEAAVVKFLSSRVRGDDAWRQAMVDDPPGKTQRSLERWDDWTLERFQLRARKNTNPNTAWIRTYFEIGIDGDTDDGEDEFTVVRVGDRWLVEELPG